MIEPGHVHNLIPFAAADQPDGSRVISLRCNASPPNADPREGCLLQQEIRVLDGKPISVLLRYAGLWFHPADMIRMAENLPMTVCPRCEGMPSNLMQCEVCYGMGVVGSDGEPVKEPGLRAT